MPDTDQLLFLLAGNAQVKAIKQRRRRLRAKGQRPAPAATNTQLKHGPQLLAAETASPQQRSGYSAEALARQYLEAAGLMVLQQNLRCQAGEIDLVCQHGPQLVFVEVRKRGNLRYGGAAASIDSRKQVRIMRTASYHLPRLSQRYFSGHTPSCRFDVIAIEAGQIHWIKNAFSLPAN